MSSLPICILYSQDADLVRRIKAFVSALAQVRHVSAPDRLDAVLHQTGLALLILDLHAKEARDLLELIQESWPEVLIIALGTPRSEPLREAEQSRIYAAEDWQMDRRRLQALVERGLEHLRVLEENRELREQFVEPVIQDRPLTETIPERHGSSMPLLRFPRLFRHFDNVEALLASIVERMADVTGVSRIGVFAKIRPSDRYRLRAGLRCLPETSEIQYGERDALVRWFELHAHLIFRGNLSQIPDQTQRTLMRRALNTFGAEVIVPLHARGNIIGWLFFGHRVTGERFSSNDLEGLMLLAEQVSTLLENALLYEEVALQKTLAETLLRSIPPGIIATDETAIVRWFNPTAETLLGIAAGDALNQPVEAVGSRRLAALLRETLDSKENLPAQQWIDANTRRSLSVETRRLLDQKTPLGAVAVLQDLTAEESLRQKQDLVDRAAFWTDLAASMSHEIRNPLVAIKTFAQLLPERFDDPDFRKDFNEIVVQEIDRLDKIITQINNFAHPSELVLKPIDVRASVRKAIVLARERVKKNGVAIDTMLPSDLPKVLGDEAALTEAFAHLVANAAEATSGQSKPRIILAAKKIREGGHSSGVVVTVKDNGKGISAELREKVFSPFCTTKARGMGLGLPIVKRTIFDHNGRVDIDSSSHGTSVSVMLPASPNGH
jgi:nitrogen-specific signal transduction histidine kinase